MEHKEAELGSEEDKKTSKVRLKSREYEVLSEFERWGILGLGQLEALVFWSDSESWEGRWKRMGSFFNEYEREVFDRYGYKRLCKVERAGYIQKFRYGVWFSGNYSWAYGLTRRGKAELEAVGLSRGFGFRRSWSLRIASDYVRINGIGLALAKILRLTVKSRHQLACEVRVPGMQEVEVQRRIPDLRIEGQRPLDVIVEARSWPTELKRWQTTKDRTLLYLIGEPSIRPLLWRAKDAGARHVYAGDIKQFRGSLGGTVFTNPDQQPATLDQLAGRDTTPWGS